MPAALALYIVLGTLFEGVEDASAWVYFLGVASASLVAGPVWRDAARALRSTGLAAA